MRDVDGPCVYVSVEDACVGVERRLTAQVGVEDREFLRDLLKPGPSRRSCHLLRSVRRSECRR
jgi:hypothetical protein